MQHGAIPMKRNLRAEVEAQSLAQLALAEKRGASLASPRAGHGRIAAAKPIMELDAQCRARSVNDIAGHIERLAAPEKSAIAVNHLNRTVRKAERLAGDGTEISGTGFTIIKRADSPITRMLNNGSIGGTELRASEDICIAFRAISGALFLKPLSMERRDRSNSIHEPAGVIDAVSRYQHWANIWSARTKRGDPTLEIIIAAIWDERPLRIIEQDLSIRNGAASRATAAGLRDYAARAGWAQGSTSQQWLVGEGSVFRLRKTAA